MKYIFLIITLLASYVSHAQIETINTDRPDQSDGTYILTKNKLQIENGLLFAKKTVVNNLMLRYGVTKSTEVRLLADFGKVEGSNGILPITLSAKQRLIKEKNWIPEITLAGYIRNEKIASKKFQSSQTTYNFLIAFQNTITDKFSVGYNVGTTSFKKDVSFTTSLGYSFTDKITCFTEYFGKYEKYEVPSHNVDAGLLYLINKKLQIDIAIGTSLQNNQERYFTTGISYRF